MDVSVFNAVVNDGGGYENIAGITLANGETIDFVGCKENHCKADFFVTLGGSLVLKKPLNHRSKKTGDYDLTGHNYISVDDFQSVIMVNAGVSAMDPRDWRL